MISFNDADALLLTNPVGIDKAIQDVQIKLQAILWLGNKAYGRAFKQEENKIIAGGGSRRLIYYPEVYQDGGEPLNVMPNDSSQAQSFFYTRDPARAVDYMPLQNNIYIHPTSLILWANLGKVDPAKQGRFTEYLKAEVLGVLRSCTGLYVTQVVESYENVFSNYTITEEYRQYMKLPYTAFRIDFDLNYKDALPNC